MVSYSSEERLFSKGQTMSQAQYLNGYDDGYADAVKKIKASAGQGGGSSLDGLTLYVVTDDGERPTDMTSDDEATYITPVALSSLTLPTGKHAIIRFTTVAQLAGGVTFTPGDVVYARRLSSDATYDDYLVLASTDSDN